MSGKKSPALQFLTLLYESSMASTGHSWTRLNSAMRDATKIAIEAGLTFGVGDFATFAKELRSTYWIGDGECIYAAACEVGNLSACQSFETWRKRPAFVQDGKRLHVGADMTWDGKRCKVTSFDRLGEFIAACTYKPSNNSERKIDRRYQVTLAELRAGERAKNPPPTPGQKSVRRFMDAHPNLFGCERAKRLMKTCADLKAAWEVLAGTECRSLSTLRSVLEAVGYQGSFAVVAGWKAFEEAWAALDYDRDIAPLVAKYERPVKKAVTT